MKLSRNFDALYMSYPSYLHHIVTLKLFSE